LLYFQKYYIVFSSLKHTSLLVPHGHVNGNNERQVMIMDEFFDQFFPTEFLIEYLENGPEENMDRFQTYVVYRFLSFAAKENPAVVTELRDTLECPLSVDNLSDIYRFLDQDFYFSPSFSENSFDPVLLCYAIAIIDDKSGFGLAILNRIFKEACPEISSVDFSDVDVDLEVLLQTEVQFYAALAICSIHYSTLIALLPKFAAAYMEDLHFTCEDFILYDFMDEYFETKNCSANPAFQEMTDTLVLATLQSFDTDLAYVTVEKPSGYDAAKEQAVLESYTEQDIKKLRPRSYLFEWIVCVGFHEIKRDHREYDQCNDCCNELYLFFIFHLFHFITSNFSDSSSATESCTKKCAKMFFRDHNTVHFSTSLFQLKSIRRFFTFL
jgi:hypothetical protein